jgi:acyl-CoA synthetase (AMP-forming)/AMP-acid ligase II
VETVKVVAVLGSVMTDPLAARVRASPDATAVIDAASGEGLTYAALDGRVGRQAAALADREVGSGDHVAIACGVGTASVTLVHAVARLGATLVPLSARLTAGELEARVRRADCEVLVVGAGIERLASAIDGAPIVPIEELAGEASGETDGKADGGEFGETGEFDGASGTGEMDGTDEERATGVGRAGRAGAMGRALDDPLAIVFTSGTTGRPKGVVLTAGNVLASAGASAARLGVLPDDRRLQHSDRVFDGVGDRRRLGAGRGRVVQDLLSGLWLVGGAARSAVDDDLHGSCSRVDRLNFTRTGTPADATLAASRQTAVLLPECTEFQTT